MANNFDSSSESDLENSATQRLSSDEKMEMSDEDKESNKTELDQHVDSVKTKDNVKRVKPPVIFRCEICLTEFENEKMLTEHLAEHDFQYSCNGCGRLFKLTFDFIDHVQRNSTDQLYKCPFCEFAAEKRYKMTLHLQSAHDQFKKYRCKICKKGSNVYTQFLQHQFTHTNETPFKCDKCDSSFAKQDLLRAHAARMHRYKSVSCNVCQKLCKSRGELRSHKTSHVRKNFTCKVCQKTLDSKISFQNHKRIHRGKKHYICKFCPSSFISRGFVTQHERTHTLEKPHVCSICSRGFSQRTSMKIHETTHQTEKPFQCNRCVRKFKSKIKCNSHIKKCSVKGAVQPQIKKMASFKDIMRQSVFLEDINPDIIFQNSTPQTIIFSNPQQHESPTTG